MSQPTIATHRARGFGKSFSTAAVMIRASPPRRRTGSSDRIRNCPCEGRAGRRGRARLPRRPRGRARGRACCHSAEPRCRRHLSRDCRRWCRSLRTPSESGKRRSASAAASWMFRRMQPASTVMWRCTRRGRVSCSSRDNERTDTAVGHGTADKSGIAALRDDRNPRRCAFAHGVRNLGGRPGAHDGQGRAAIKTPLLDEVLRHLLLVRQDVPRAEPSRKRAQESVIGIRRIRHGERAYADSSRQVQPKAALITPPPSSVEPSFQPQGGPWRPT